MRNVTPIDEYVMALARELDARSVAAWRLDTLYMGGGTPSRLGGRGIGDIVAMVRERGIIEPDAEITIEANPDDVSPAAVSAWRDAGVNRVSLGGQSFDEEVLAWMHRSHTSAQIGEAVRMLRDSGIANVSLDLIFAVPAALNRDWARDLAHALALEPSHISLYGLTVEPHTPLGRSRDRGDLAEAPEENYEREFLLAHQTLVAAGFEHYEISNFARPGLRSRHNSSYWSGVAYAGLGPSSHEFDGNVRSWNVAAYAEWQRRLAAAEPVIAGWEQLTPENRNAERVYLGLRTDCGLEATDAELLVARPWLAAGWATVNNRTIVLTSMGQLRLDALAASLTMAGSY